MDTAYNRSKLEFKRGYTCIGAGQGKVMYPFWN